jgi:aldehyde:ferredoxin oxidoreductase
MAEKFMTRNRACHKCVIGCGRETRSETYGDPKVDGPEYETIGTLGSLLMIFDLQAVIHAGHLANLYGLDVISLGVTIALACELFERGLLTKADTGGLEIRYGDPEMVFRLIELTARREGFGAILAEGNAALAEHAGAPELSATVNRLEVPMHDPRAYVGMAVTYALSPRGACHMQGDMFDLDMGRTGLEEIGLEMGDRHENSVEKGRTAAGLAEPVQLPGSVPVREPGRATATGSRARCHRLGYRRGGPDAARQEHREHQAPGELQAGPDQGGRPPAGDSAEVT